MLLQSLEQSIPSIGFPFTYANEDDNNHINKNHYENNNILGDDEASARGL